MFHLIPQLHRYMEWFVTDDDSGPSILERVKDVREWILPLIAALLVPSVLAIAAFCKNKCQGQTTEGEEEVDTNATKANQTPIAAQTLPIEVSSEEQKDLVLKDKRLPTGVPSPTSLNREKHTREDNVQNLEPSQVLSEEIIAVTEMQIEDGFEGVQKKDGTVYLQI